MRHMFPLSILLSFSFQFGVVAYALALGDIPRADAAFETDDGDDCVAWDTPFGKILSAADIGIEGHDTSQRVNDYFPVQKVLIQDCRAVRGFINYPVDGRLDSRDYAPRGSVVEWPSPGIVSYGLLSFYMHNMSDGLHILLDDDRFNGMLIRSTNGFKGTLLRDNDKLSPPWNGKVVCRFAGDKLMEQKYFTDAVVVSNISFVDKVNGKTLGDVSFLRVGSLATPKEYKGKIEFFPAAHYALPDEFKTFFSRYFKNDSHALYFTRRDAACSSNGFSGAVGREKSGFIHFIVPPPRCDLALGAVAIQLKLADFGKNEHVYISVRDPFSPRRELMGYNFPVGEKGEVKACLDFPDQIVPAGASIWIAIRTDKARVIADNDTPRINLLLADAKQAQAEYLKYRLFLFRGIFAAASEARSFARHKGELTDRATKETIIREDKYAGDTYRELFETIDELRRLYPDDDKVRLYHEWIYTHEGMDMFPKYMKANLKRDAKSRSVPDWAFAAEQNIDAILRVADWWITNRQIPDGEFGGSINDDTDLLQQFYGISLIRSVGTGARIQDACRRLNELALGNIFTNGMHIMRMNALHGYEEGINTASIMPMLCYGDPLDFERLMEICRATLKLTVKRDGGRRYFRKNLFNAAALDDNELGIQNYTHFLYLHPFCMVAWYNKNATATEFVHEIIKGLVAHGNKSGVPKDIDVKNDAPVTNTPYENVFGMFYIPAILSTYVSDPASLDYLKSYVAPDRMGQLDNMVFIRSPTPLTRRIERDACRMKHFEYIHTAAEIFTDRIYMDKRALFTMCLGYHPERDAWAPIQHASYEGFTEGFAPRLIEARSDLLKVALYNSAEKTQQGLIRVWRLDNGKYRITQGPDDNGDDAMDKCEREIPDLPLTRHAGVPVSVPSRKIWIVEIRQCEKGDDFRLRPDMAVSPREISRDNNAKEISFWIHNIGAKPSGAFKVALFSGDKKLQEISVENMDCPVDLFPRKRRLVFKDVPDEKNLKIVLDPDDKIREITKENNYSVAMGGQ